MTGRRVASLSCVFALAVNVPFGIPAEGFPQRIVSTAPSLTETLFSLGVGDRVVGVTTWCRYPEEAQAKPKIGGYSTPSMEAILALHPDLVVLAAETRNDVGRRLAELHVPTMEVRLDSLRSIEDSIRQIARGLGVAERGEALAARIEAQRAAVVRAVAGRPHVRTLLLLGHSPDALTSLYAVGPKSFLGEMLEAAGGENVLSDVRTPYPRISVEEVIGRDPDVILAILSPPADATDAAARARQLWSAYPSLRAVRMGAIRAVVDDTIVQPGPRVGEKIAILAEALHGVRP
jgi:ABC-type Fe3+-hydroxamate transport system substrate-binding protein